MFTNLLAFFEETVTQPPLEWGQVLLFISMAIAFIPAGIGSAIAVARSGQTMAGIVSEKPEVYSKLQIIQLLPATQGLYGFIIAFLIGLRGGIFGAELATLTNEQGLMFLASSLPVAIVGFSSALMQAKIGCSAQTMVGKNPDMSGKGILMTAVVELYAIFGLIVSFLIVFLGVKV